MVDHVWQALTGEKPQRLEKLHTIWERERNHSMNVVLFPASAPVAHGVVRRHISDDAFDAIIPFRQPTASGGATRKGYAVPMWVPSGRSENSPALQCRDQGKRNEMSPAGTTENYGD
jgi:hypothetical protein